VIREVVIRRIDSAATCVADTCADNPWMTPEPGVRCPESTEPERRGLDDGCLLLIEREHHAQCTPQGPDRLLRSAVSRSLAETRRRLAEVPFERATERRL
jgi:hypothetical protein